MSLGFRALPGAFDLTARPLVRLTAVSRKAADDTAGNVLQPLPHGESVHGEWGRHWLRPLAGAALLTGTALARRFWRQEEK
jgi:hypothetical protein